VYLFVVRRVANCALALRIPFQFVVHCLPPGQYRKQEYSLVQFTAILAPVNSRMATTVYTVQLTRVNTGLPVLLPARERRIP
jgi:hypothetical protein